MFLFLILIFYFFHHYIKCYAGIIYFPSNFSPLFVPFLSYYHLSKFKQMHFTCVVFTQITYQFFHWKKGTPFAEDLDIYNGLTCWVQIENGQPLTCNRKISLLFLFNCSKVWMQRCLVKN